MLSSRWYIRKAQNRGLKTFCFLCIKTQEPRRIRSGPSAKRDCYLNTFWWFILGQVPGTGFVMWCAPVLNINRVNSSQVVTKLSRLLPSNAVTHCDVNSNVNWTLCQRKGLNYVKKKVFPIVFTKLESIIWQLQQSVHFHFHT